MVSLRTRPTIQIWDQYIRKEESVHLSGIQMVGLWVFKLHSNIGPFGIQLLFDHLNT